MLYDSANLVHILLARAPSIIMLSILVQYFSYVPFNILTDTFLLFLHLRGSLMNASKTLYTWSHEISGLHLEHPDVYAEPNYSRHLMLVLKF